MVFRTGRRPLPHRPLAVAVLAAVATALAACGPGDGSGGGRDADDRAPSCGAGRERAAAAGDRPVPDFDGDRYADLAVPGPLGTVDGVELAGSVSVVYGSRSGPDAAGAQVISRATDGALGRLAARGTQFGTSPVARDLDGDGFTDLAVTVSGETPSAIVMWGSADGLSGGIALPGGNGLYGGDFNGDDRADLIVGDRRGGGPVVLYGPLDRDGDACRSQRLGGSMSWGDATAPETVSVGDVTGDGSDDVITTQSFEEMQEQDRFFAGGPRGLARTPRDLPSYSGNGLIADLDADGHGDFVGRDVGEVSEMSQYDAGALVVRYGTASGPGRRTETLGPRALGLAGDSGSDDAGSRDVDGDGRFTERDDVDRGDQLGAALDAADYDGDGRTDLAVGLPGANDGPLTDTGAVALLPGGENGPVPGGARLLTPGSPGMPGTGERTGRFGTALWTADMNRDGHPELAVGAPGVRDGEHEAGAVWILPGTRRGPQPAGATSFGPAATGAPVEGSDGEMISWTGTRFGHVFPR